MHQPTVLYCWTLSNDRVSPPFSGLSSNFCRVCFLACRPAKFPHPTTILQLLVRLQQPTRVSTMSLSTSPPHPATIDWMSEWRLVFHRRQLLLKQRKFRQSHVLLAFDLYQDSERVLGHYVSFVFSRFCYAYNSGCVCLTMYKSAFSYKANINSRL